MDSQYKSLYYFTLVAKELNMSTVANNVYISQQALSKHIQHLEKTLGVQLFQRTPRLELTAEGHRVLLYAKTILSAYEELPEADIIAFRMKNQPSRLKQKKQRLNSLTALRIASWQITCRREAVQRKGIYFDTLMGAGSGNGAQEEVKFLRDCMKRGLKAWYVPEDIGEVGNAYYESGEQEGTWFTGFDEKFFYQRGTSTRYLLGLPLSVLYAFY